MKIDFWNKEGSVLLTRSGGESLKVSIMEFWEICRHGARLDVMQEIDNYLFDNGEFEGVDGDVIRGSEAFLDEVVDRVLDVRASKENTEQIHDAISYCLKHGKHKDELVDGADRKSIRDMTEEDFQDVDRRREFGTLLRQYRDLHRQLNEINALPQGGDRDTAAAVKLSLSNVTNNMDILRVKEWLSRQPYDLDTESAGYREATDIVKVACEWVFPEFAKTVFGSHGAAFLDRDYIFKEPDLEDTFVLYYYFTESAAAQLVCCPFNKADAEKMVINRSYSSVLDNNDNMEFHVGTKDFFAIIFDILKMKQNGYYLGNDIQTVCKEIFVRQCEQGRCVVVDSVQQSVWHGEVDVPYGFPGLDEIDYDSMALAAEGLLNKRLGSVGLFEDVSVERVGYYNGGVGYSFSFTANVSADAAAQLLQKALEGLKFEAFSDVQKDGLDKTLADAHAKYVEQDVTKEVSALKQDGFVR